MARAGISRGDLQARASKQLAGEWESFKRQGEEEILIRPWISQRRSHFYNLFTVSLSLTNTGSQSALSHFTQDNFLKAAVGKREGVGVEGTAVRTESEEEFKKTDELRVRRHEKTRAGKKTKLERSNKKRKRDANGRRHAMEKEPRLSRRRFVVVRGAGRLSVSPSWWPLPSRCPLPAEGQWVDPSVRGGQWEHKRTESACPALHR